MTTCPARQTNLGHVTQAVPTWHSVSQGVSTQILGSIPQQVTLCLQGKARECAIEVQLQAHEVDTVLGNPPPQLQLEKACAADARWFNKRWLLAHSKGQPLFHCP